MPLLGQLLPLFSSRLIRNRATLGGNLVTASPIGDGPPVLLALDASVTLRARPAARRCRCASSSSPTARPRSRPDEVMIDVRVPRRAPAHPALLQGEQARARRHLDGRRRVRARPDAGRTRGAARGSPTAASPRRRSARPRSSEALTGQPWTPETAAALLVDRRRRRHADDRPARQRRVSPRDGRRGCSRSAWPTRRRRRAGGCGPMNQPVGRCDAPVVGAACRTNRGRSRHRRGALRRRPVARRRRTSRTPGRCRRRTRTRASCRSTPRRPGSAPGVLAVLTAEDVPGENDIGPARHDEPLFPSEVCFHGQAVAWVIAETGRGRASRRGRGRGRVRAAAGDPLDRGRDRRRAASSPTGERHASRRRRGGAARRATSPRRRAAHRRPGALLPRDAGGAGRSAIDDGGRASSTRRRSTRPRCRRSSRTCSACRATRSSCSACAWAAASAARRRRATPGPRSPRSRR